MENEFSPKLNSKVFNDVQEISDFAIPNVASVNLSLNDDHGGFILGALEDMIRIGQSMGYDMEGCSKDIERIIVRNLSQMNIVSDELPTETKGLYLS
ncbi:hypothetical protein Tco_1496250 [Tanacetum coccineum]